MTKASPGPTSKLRPATVNSKRPDFTSVDCTCGWLCGGADALGGEGDLDEHQLRALGEHAAGGAVADVDGGEAADSGIGHGASQWKSDGSQSETAGM